MKKLLLLLVLCVFALSAYAEDVIVGLDGSMIQSKVVEVTQSEIKYKKAGNLEGPTYSILKSQVKSILYENGTTEEIAQVLVNTAYAKSGKNFKVASWIVGGSMFLGGLILGTKATSDYNEGKIDDYDVDTKQGWGYALMGAGAVTWGVLYFRGCALEKRAERYQVSQLSAFEIPVCNQRTLMTSVDVVRDSQTGAKSYGLGLNFRF